jgi:hypothetical protein
MSISYTTEGNVRMDCPDRVTDPIVANWIKGSKTVRILSGPKTIILSRSQLEQLVKLGPDIAQDLKGEGFAVSPNNSKD